MTLEDALISVWRQVVTEGKARVELEGKFYRVTHSPAKKLRIVEFEHGTQRILGIVQNPQSASRGAPKARQGKWTMQFQSKGRYIGSVSERKIVR